MQNFTTAIATVPASHQALLVQVFPNATDGSVEGYIWSDNGRVSHLRPWDREATAFFKGEDGLDEIEAAMVAAGWTIRFAWAHLDFSDGPEAFASAERPS